MAESGRRNENEPLLIALLAAGKTIPAAAAKAGYAERTAFRRAQAPEIKARVRKLRDEMFSRAVAEFTSLAAAAVETVRQLLASDSENIRLAACRLLFDQAPRLREHCELAARIGELEQGNSQGRTQ